MVSDSSLWFQQMFQKNHLKCSLKAYEWDTGAVKKHYKDTGRLYQTDVGINCFEIQVFDNLCKRMSLALRRVAKCKNLQPAVIRGHLHLFHVQSVCCFLLGLLFVGMSFTIGKTPLSCYCVAACPAIPPLYCLVPGSVHGDTSPEYHSCWCSLGKVLKKPGSQPKLDLENFRRRVVINDVPFCPSINQLLPWRNRYSGTVLIKFSKLLCCPSHIPLYGQFLFMHSFLSFRQFV